MKGLQFDPVAVADWISNNVWIFLLIAFVAFIFHIFRPNGFAIEWIKASTRKRELDAKQLDDARFLANIFSRKYDRPDPLLPFDDDVSERS